MAISYTYSSLVTELQSYEEDDGSEFAAQIPNIILGAEQAVVRDLRLSLFDSESSSQTTSNGNHLVTKPTGTINTWELGYIDTNSDFQRLERRDWGYMQAYWPNRSTTGAPLFYSDMDSTQWYLAPTPNATYTLRCRVQIHPTGLSGSNTTTFVSQRFGDLLFARCMMDSERFLKSDRVKTFREKYAEELLPAALDEVQEMVRARFIIPTGQGG
jgi:hypothetical protein